MKDRCSWGILGEELRNFWWQVLEDFLIDKLVFFHISKMEILCGITKIFHLNTLLNTVYELQIAEIVSLTAFIQYAKSHSY